MGEPSSHAWHGQARLGWWRTRWRCSAGRAGRVTQGHQGLAGSSVVLGGMRTQGPDTVLLLSSPRLPGVSLRQKLGPQALVHALPNCTPPCLTVPHLPLMQGYKMDDLLTSYVQQLISTVNRQRGPRSSVPSHP